MVLCEFKRVALYESLVRAPVGPASQTSSSYGSCRVFYGMAVVRIKVCSFVLRLPQLPLEIHSGDLNPRRWKMLVREMPSRWWCEVGFLETILLNELQLTKCRVPCLYQTVFLWDRKLVEYY